MRKSFDGLQGLVQEKLKRRATSGEVFIFINKRRDRVNRTAEAAIALGGWRLCALL